MTLSPLRKLAPAAALLAFALSTAHAATSDEAPGFWSTPTIQGYGKIHYLPNAAFKPDARHAYKIVLSLTQAAPAPDKVNSALEHVARTVNLYVAAGVPLSHLKIVAVAYGAATPLALDDAHYRIAFGVPNPNSPLLAELKKAGVTVSVCGQAVAEHHFEYDWLSNDVTLALSGLTTVTTLESQGYVLMPQ
jgi:intracellular sulfur oxidation DsrE/DsrF family protein